MTTPNVRLRPDRELLIATLDEVYYGRAWHGPSVREALAGITADVAAANITATRNSIWDLVLHLAHGRHLLIERIRERTEDFPRDVREPWWPAASIDHSDDAWTRDRALLDAYQSKLIAAIRDATPAQLTRDPIPGGQSVAHQLLGLAIHDAYHAGQIRLLALTHRAQPSEM